MASISPTGGRLRGGARLTAAVVLAAVLAFIAAYSLNLLAPSLVVETYAGGRPVDAFVQVFAVLPPGGGRSLVEVWNGTALDGVARVPLTALAEIAERWADEGYGGEGVGVEVVATYADGTAVYYNLEFATYRPDQLLSAVSNPLIGAMRLNYKTVQMDLDLKAEVGGSGAAARTSTLPVPACFWLADWSWQTPQMMIPVAWIFNEVPNYLSGSLEAFYSLLTTTTVSFYASAGITRGGSAGITYRFIGTSTQVSMSYWTTPTNTTYWTGISSGLGHPSGGFIYHLGTLGAAELQLYCYDGTTYVPADQYAYEAYVASIANNGRLYTSYDNISYINGFMSLYSKYTGTNLQYVPFDEIYLPGNGTGYGYWSSNIDVYNSLLVMPRAIPIGLMIGYASGGSLSIPRQILANLVAGLQIPPTEVNIIGVLVGHASSYPAYGDLLVVALPVTYSQSGESYHPYMVGFYVTGLGNYSSGTSIYVDGPGVVYSPCLWPVEYYNWTVYVYIGDGPLLVPGGSVTATLYDSSGDPVWSGTFDVPTSFDDQPPHRPAVVSVPWTAFNYGIPYSTYTMVIAYNGYTTEYGSIHYGTSTAEFTIHASYQRCG